MLVIVLLSAWQWQVAINSGTVCCQGVPGNGRFRHPEDVGVVCTSLIFTCTVLHSAVNYPQYHEYGFPPNYPLILNGMPPSDKVRSTLHDLSQSVKLYIYLASVKNRHIDNLVWHTIIVFVIEVVSCDDVLIRAYMTEAANIRSLGLRHFFYFLSQFREHRWFQFAAEPRCRVSIDLLPTVKLIQLMCRIY